MPKSPKQPARKASKPKGRGDWSVMSGPIPKTTPAPIRPIFVPQRRFNVGMDRFP